MFLKAEFAKNPEDRYDIMTLLPKSNKKAKKDDTAGIIISCLVIVGIIFGVYKARQAAN